MSRMLSKMNLISVVQQLPKEDIETIQGYVEMIEQENDVQKVMIENFVKENQELKKQIEEYKRLGFKHLNDKCNKLENQQKEFIEYLENMIDSLEKIQAQRFNHSIQFKLEIAKHNLSKYKEIIGGKDE